jgi:hypothetical protein
LKTISIIEKLDTITKSGKVYIQELLKFGIDDIYLTYKADNIYYNNDICHELSSFKKNIEEKFDEFKEDWTNKIEISWPNDIFLYLTKSDFFVVYDNKYIIKKIPLSDINADIEFKYLNISGSDIALSFPIESNIQEALFFKMKINNKKEIF